MDKETENKEEKNEESKEGIISLNKKQNKQVFIILILAITALLMVTLVPFTTNYVIKNYFDKFEFINLDFQKKRIGNLVFYEAEVPVINENGLIYKTYKVRFREDPRKTMEEVEVDDRVDYEGGIQFIKNRTVYISVDPNMKECEDNKIAAFNLASFLVDSGLKIKSAMTDKEKANLSKTSYKTCDHSSKNTIIILKSGERNFIDQERVNCYELIYKECDINKVVERFNLQILSEYMRKFKKIN